MELSFTDEELSFREEVREFFKDALPPDIRRKCERELRLSRADIVRWQRILNEKGWATPAWSMEWGGTGWDVVQQYIFKEEMYLAPAPEVLNFNVSMLGPVIIEFGTEQQKQHFLPRMANLDYWFCQGFSEPGSGSDLASLRTSAKLDGDNYIVNGQKIWTTLGHHANWCFLLARTDPDAKKQAGISFFLVDMDTPGITVRPIISIDGNHEFNEVFFDDVRIPVANRIGEENQGWTYAKLLLGNERTGVARIGLCKQRIKRAVAASHQVMIDDSPLSDDTRFRERVAALEVELKALEMMQMRVIANVKKSAGGKPDPMAPIMKIRGSELQQATTQLMIDVAGYGAMEFDPEFVCGGEAPAGGEDWALSAAPNHYWLRHTTISGGTNEIQRNILAKTVLGL